MANITQQNNVRYQIDTLKLESFGVLQSKTGSELVCPEGSQCKGFNITASQPTGTKIFFLFSDGTSSWFKLKSDGTAQPIDAQTLDYDVLEESGNTVAELKALTRITAFEGKTINYAVGLLTPDADNYVPSVKFTLKILTDTQMLNKTEYSPIYELGSKAQIATMQYDYDCTQDASLELTAQITREDGSKSEFVEVNNVAGEKASAIQFRAIYKVKAVGQGSATLNEARTVYTDGSTIVSGLASSEIYSKSEDWFINVSQCRMSVRHAPLLYSNIRAAVAFRSKLIVVHDENLGTGTGTRTTYQLANTGGIRYDSISLYFDNKKVFSDYEINTQVGRITCSAPEGSLVSCDYEYNWDQEEWHDMELTERSSIMQYDISEFKYTQPMDAEKRSVCAVKLILDMDSGQVTNEVIGKGTGKSQTYKLAHIVKDGKITITSNGTELASKNWVILNNPQYVKITAPLNATIRASYDWISETPRVYQFVAVFAD